MDPGYDPGISPPSRSPACSAHFGTASNRSIDDSAAVSSNLDPELTEMLCVGDLSFVSRLNK